MLAVAVPSIALASGLALRGRALRLIADKRGVALQTVIVIVVMLAIAGAVAGVLLSRGSEVTSDLESQNVGGGIDSAAECTAHMMGAEAGDISGTTCTWQHDDVSPGSCQIVGGTFTATSNAAVNSDGDADATDDACVLNF